MKSLFRCCSARVVNADSTARAGKAAIYRRWPSKLAFAAEALETVPLRLTGTSDHGALPEDIQSFLMMLRRVLRHPLVKRILPDLFAEQARAGESAPLL